ncbi:esterase-like activity of phytase family protein [Polaribacter sp. IC073]|uniref:esterase-like activity of phytase family protein n=1 Tax=Polaribacter sp. IC073 TaxID=2508540 RepID=UPI0011BE803F|nr:esterase-like activity of phytase family protein [Polaribacter sp. IC073]TXD47254.1 esterase-like activity of phytase family protein [Polaribacter sp. IC073]
MYKIFIFLLLIINLYSCGREKNIDLQFVSEFVVKDSVLLKNTIIGGLSGVDYSNGFYYFVVDDARKPRFLKARITIDQRKITGINFDDVIFLNDTTTNYYKENSLDLESIFVDEEKQEINFSSEGSIAKGRRPIIFTTDFSGNFISEYQLPKSLQNIENIKHNGALEGSSKSMNTKGFWSIMEAPLKNDGQEPTFSKTQSPVRITYYDAETKKATKQFAYQLEHITKPAKGNVNLNGVTAILEYDKNKFFIIERTYQSGYGSYGNIVRVFDAEITTETTNILNVNSLKDSKFAPLKKRLLINFEDLKDKLTDGIIDNIEGITFGPILENGNQSLLLVSDDNFQVYGKQLNQFILLEMVRE